MGEVLLVLLFIGACVLFVSKALETPPQKRRYERPRSSLKSRGDQGEERVSRELFHFLDRSEYRLFNDLTLPSFRGTTQVDHVLVSKYGIFVIETKNMAGWIFGGENQSHWTRVQNKHKLSFQNPIRQNFKHVKAVEEWLGFRAIHLYNVITFVGTAVPKTEMPANVLWNIEALANFVKAKTIVVFNAKEIEAICDALSNPQIRTDDLKKHRHIQHLRDLKARKLHDNHCPRCGEQLVQRTNRQTGEAFMGCERFPKCRGTRKLH